jgi:hypothetical protein
MLPGFAGRIHTHPKPSLRALCLFPLSYWRPPAREGRAEGFAFQKFHGDVGRAVIGLAGFVNGDDIHVMNAGRGSRFILKAQQEVGVIQQLAAQHFERHRTVAERDLLGEVDGTHTAFAQAADQPETTR